MRSKVKQILPYLCLTLIVGSSAAMISMMICNSSNVIKSGSSGQPVTINGSTVETSLVTRHTVEYIEKPVTEVKYIEQVKSIFREYTNFTTLDELKQWIFEYRNSTVVRLQSPGSVIDCDDYALELQHKALGDGYIVSFEIIGEEEYNNLFSHILPPGSSLHAINLAIIGNNIYYIEPQTGEVVLAAFLD